MSDYWADKCKHDGGGGHQCAGLKGHVGAHHCNMDTYQWNDSGEFVNWLPPMAGVTAPPPIVEDVAKATYESYWPGNPWPNPEMSKEVETAWYRLAQAAVNVVRERLK